MNIFTVVSTRSCIRHRPK